MDARRSPWHPSEIRTHEVKSGERTNQQFYGRGMTPYRDEELYLRAVAVAVLVAMSGVALRGHLPAGALNPFAGAIGDSTALGIGVVVLGIALLMAVRPLIARIGDWHRAAMRAADPAEWLPTKQPRPMTGRGMWSLVIGGSCLALLAQFVAMCLPDRGDAHALTGLAVGLVLIGMRGHLSVVVADPPASYPAPDDTGESLQRWVSRTEALIHWSEGTRSDWDLHVRPILARQFEMATKANQRRTTDPGAFHATGTMLFGIDLWRWVDPDNVVRGGVSRPGPGRRRLEGILQCLEQA